MRVSEACVCARVVCGGGAMRIDSTMQSTVTRSYFHEFASHGIYGSDDYQNASWPGHELIVDSCWFEEWQGTEIHKMPAGTCAPPSPPFQDRSWATEQDLTLLSARCRQTNGHGD